MPKDKVYVVAEQIDFTYMPEKEKTEVLAETKGMESLISLRSSQ